MLTFIAIDFVQSRWLSLILPEATLLLNYLGLIDYRAAAASRTPPD